MAKTIEDAVKRVQALAKALPGMRAAPDYPPDAIPQAPFVVSAPARGDWARQADWKTGLHTIVCLLGVPHKNLASDIERLLPFAESFPNAIWGDPTLNGTVDTVNAVRYTFGAQSYAGIELIGYRFEVDFKQESSVT